MSWWKFWNKSERHKAMERGIRWRVEEEVMNRLAMFQKNGYIKAGECPKCKKSLSINVMSDNVFCWNCGWNSRLGRSILDEA